MAESAGKGILKVTVVKGKRLAVRDFKTSDPYVILKLGNQVAKTKVISSCLNPVWNEDLTFTLHEPAGEVFDRDRFKADDKMGHAHMNLQPLVSAARLSQILKVGPGETTLRKVVPESDNCLVRESTIDCVNGDVIQDVWLRLCDVESGEVNIKLKLKLTNTSPKVTDRERSKFEYRSEYFNAKAFIFVGSKGHSHGMSKRKLPLSVTVDGGKSETTEIKKERVIELGNDSQVIYIPKFLGCDESWKWLDYLNTQIPWTRPTIRVFGRSCLQPRDTCYVATPGLPELVYSGYHPRAYSWDDYPTLKELLDLVHMALPGSSFNSLLLNRYKGGNDYVGWHADDEKLYGPCPEIASLSFGCERDFILKRKPAASSKKSSQGIIITSFGIVHSSEYNFTQLCYQYIILDENTSKRLKRSNDDTDQHSFNLKHGSLLVMRGNTQRDWVHSVPKRAKADVVRINLTFRYGIYLKVKMVNVIRTPKEANTSAAAAEVGEIDTRAPFQSVKAAVSLFGETISTPGTKQTFLKKSKSTVEGVIDKEAEYHFAQKELGKCKSQVKYAETTANKALPELEKAMKTLLDLKEKIKSVNESTQSIIEDTENLKIKAKELEEAQTSKDENTKVGNADQVNSSRQEYKAAAAELDAAKQELSSLHTDYEEAMEAKSDALQMAEEAELAVKTHTDKIAELSEEIEKMKESLDEVKLSTQESTEQLEKIAAEKDEEERVFRAAKEEVEKKRVALLEEESENVETMEMKLEERNKEIKVLQENIEQAKDALSESERNAYSELKAVQEELKEVERENQFVQKAVNDLKLELANVGKEIAGIRDKEAEADSLAGELKLELQERKQEFETALASEGNDTKACDEMVMKLEKLNLETKKAKEEAEEMNISAEEMKREAKLAEEMAKKLELVTKEAEEAEAAEKNAQNELRILKERSVEKLEDGKRVSKDDYDSMKEKASEPEKLAETKEATALAEIEALKVSKNVAEVKLEEILREIKEIDKATEEAFKQAEMADTAKSMVESELKRRRGEHQAANVVVS
ncbi:hypothetical protein V2J09_003333 [Rumex salicifolius]